VNSFFKGMGAGVGLRPCHYSEFLNHKPKSVSWVEVISENFMAWKGCEIGPAFKTLQQIRNDYELGLHGVSLSIGSIDPVDKDYLQRLKDLIERTQPRTVSDHLCWTGVDGYNVHDLLPVPYTQECLDWTADKLDQVQNFLGRQILIENPSSYIEFKKSDMTEWEFIAELIRKTGCGLLLDINNVYVSSVNHGFDAKTYLNSLPHAAVGQIHLAGHSVGTNGILIDTHDAPVCDQVWDLHRWYVQNFGSVGTMIERDGNIPEWSVLESEILKIGEAYNEAPLITL